jgi:hypothetical protein
MTTGRAVREINAILAALEVSAGQFVESVEICSVDVTTVRDGRQQLARTVQITLKPIPGSQWQT